MRGATGQIVGLPYRKFESVLTGQELHAQENRCIILAECERGRVGANSPGARSFAEEVSKGCAFEKVGVRQPRSAKPAPSAYISPRQRLHW